MQQPASITDFLFSFKSVRVVLLDLPCNGISRISVIHPSFLLPSLLASMVLCCFCKSFLHFSFSTVSYIELWIINSFCSTNSKHLNFIRVFSCFVIHFLGILKNILHFLLIIELYFNYNISLSSFLPPRPLIILPVLFQIHVGCIYVFIYNYIFPNITY